MLVYQRVVTSFVWQPGNPPNINPAIASGGDGRRFALRPHGDGNGGNGGHFMPPSQCRNDMKQDGHDDETLVKP